MHKHATRDYKDMINAYLKDGGQVTQCPTVHATRDYKDMINAYLKDGGQVTQCPTVHATLNLDIRTSAKIGTSSGVPLHDIKGVVVC